MSGAKRRLESIALEDSEDRISDLPDNLIDLILDKLPVADVVRTSVLTTRWKPCRRRMGKLVLEESFFDQFIQPMEFEFSSLVDSLLLRLFGPVDEFILHVPSSVLEQDSVDATQWFMFLSRNGIKNLEILASSEYLTIPSEVFSCSNLESLTLHNCEIKTGNSLCGLSNLTHLNLEAVIISGTLLEALTFDSPLLEVLLLSLVLKGKQVVVVGGPKLRVLRYWPILFPRPLLLKYSPSCTEVLLKSELILPVDQSLKSKFNYFVHCLPRLETITLLGDFLNSLAGGVMPMELPSTFHYLKHVQLGRFEINSVRHISSAFVLIQSAPNMESMILSIFQKGEPEMNKEAAANILKGQMRAYNLSRLRKVEFNGLSGSENELLLIKVILSCCSTLETASVECDFAVEGDDELWLFKQVLNLQIPETTVIKFRPFWLRNEQLFNRQEGGYFWLVKFYSLLLVHVLRCKLPYGHVLALLVETRR